MAKAIAEYILVIIVLVMVGAIVINALTGMNCTGEFGEVMC
jgi:hypothetical protein